VAVAPVRNLTGDPDRQYLVDAFTDDLVTDLVQDGRGRSLVRIAGERRYLGNLPRAAEPEIDFVMTGSAQHGSPGTLRINLQITDAAGAAHGWAGRYEFSPEELASIRTKITGRVSRELQILVLQEASRRVGIGSDVGPEVNECLSRAAAALGGVMRAELSAEAQRWFLAALARDPRNVEALTGLALTCQHLVSQPWWWGDSRAVAMASDLGREAVALAPGHAPAKCTHGMLCSAAGLLQEAAQAFQQALAMDPGLAYAHGWAGHNAAFLGRAGETLPAVERALRLDRSNRRQSIFFFGGFAELLLGRTEAAIALFHKSLERNPRYGATQLFLIAALSLIGRRSEAARMAASFREQYPEYRASTLEQQWLWRSTSATYRAQIHPLLEKIRSLGVEA
jgi:adenylate cyclase